MVFHRIYRILFLIGILTCTPLNAQQQPIRILASFSILADWIQEIGGRYVSIESIVGPDTDPHVFSPTPYNVRQIQKADIIFFNGLGLEGWWPRLLKASKFKGPVVIMTQKLEHIHPHGRCRCGHHDPHDPHIWHSIPKVIEVIPLITETLSAKDPTHKKYYQKRAKAYLKKLKFLDQWVRKRINQIPKNKRIIITAHDAFSYFGHEYGVTFQAPNGLSTDAEPSSKDVAALIDLIKKDNIKALFLENMTNPRIMNQLSKETHVQIVGVLYSDALSTNKGPATNYISMMRHNVKLMIQAMQMNG